MSAKQKKGADQFWSTPLKIHGSFSNTEMEYKILAIH